MPETAKDGEWVEGQLPIIEEKCPPVSRMRYDGTRWIKESRYPITNPEYVDSEIYETDAYAQEDKEEFYDYPTRCKACWTEFIAYDKEEERTMNFCPHCGKRLKGEEA